MVSKPQPLPPHLCCTLIPLSSLSQPCSARSSTLSCHAYVALLWTLILPPSLPFSCHVYVALLCSPPTDSHPSSFPSSLLSCVCSLPMDSYPSSFPSSVLSCICSSPMDSHPSSFPSSLLSCVCSLPMDSHSSCIPFFLMLHSCPVLICCVFLLCLCVWWCVYVTQSFDISVITRDVTCVTAFSDSMSPSVIESQYLWWPLGSRWGTTKESSILTEVISTVVVYMGTVSLLVMDMFYNIGNLEKLLSSGKCRS